MIGNLKNTFCWLFECKSRTIVLSVWRRSICLVHNNKRYHTLFAILHFFLPYIIISLLFFFSPRRAKCRCHVVIISSARKFFKNSFGFYYFFDNTDNTCVCVCFAILKTSCSRILIGRFSIASLIRLKMRRTARLLQSFLISPVYCKKTKSDGISRWLLIVSFLWRPFSNWFPDDCVVILVGKIRRPSRITWKFTRRTRVSRSGKAKKKQPADALLSSNSSQECVLHDGDVKCPRQFAYFIMSIIPWPMSALPGLRRAQCQHAWHSFVKKILLNKNLSLCALKSKWFF